MILAHVFETYSEDCFLVILRGINLNQGSEPDDMLSLRILWFNNTLITTRKVPSRAVSQLLSDLENGSGPRSLDSVFDLFDEQRESINCRFF
ncbi:CorA family divalent cation transporter [Vibrio sinaloensis]|nr:CorA family divalent cation transporter [Vibrio sinaloensis]